VWEQRRIRIQLDNAPPHLKPGKLRKRIADRLAEYSADGWDIDFALQPANLPDLNTLDLAFFRAVQSLQYQKPANNLDEMIKIVHEAYTDLPLDVCKNVWTTAQLVMNQVLQCNGGNDYKLPHVGKLKIAAANGRAIPMRLPCRALIAGNHLNADAITAAIVSSNQITPARLFLIVRFLSMHLFDCCVSSAVAHCDAVLPLPLPPPPCIDCVHRAAAHLPLSYCTAVVHRNRAAAVYLVSTATTTGDHQNAAEALLGLFQESTPDNESLIVGLDSLSIGDADDNSMEDPLADGNAADGNATDGDMADGDMEDGEAAMNGLWQMGQRL
jgi:hypothetical protein